MSLNFHDDVDYPSKPLLREDRRLKTFFGTDIESSFLVFERMSQFDNKSVDKSNLKNPVIENIIYE